MHTSSVHTTGCGVPKCPLASLHRSPLSLGPGLPRYVPGIHQGMSRGIQECALYVLEGTGMVGGYPGVSRILGPWWGTMPKSDLTTDMVA